MIHHSSGMSVTAGQAAPAPLSPAVHTKGGLVTLSLFILQSLWVLPLGCAVGFAWANLAPEGFFTLTNPLRFAVNDVGMALFFAIIAKEVVEAALPGGALHPWRRALLPAIGALGGAVTSVAIYLLFLRWVAEPMLLSNAWAVPCATDIAMCYLVSGLIFGRHPAIPFILLLAIASDVLGVVLIAIFHPLQHQMPIGLVLVVAAMAVALALRRSGVKSFWMYLAGPGALSWFGLYLTGVHPAMALVPVVPFMPHSSRDAGLFVEPAPQDHDTLSEFERWWEVPVQVVLFLFGLLNAGVPVHGLEAGMWAMPIAVLLGRPLGVIVAVEAGVALGLQRTIHVGWRETFVIGCAASVGLGMSLYFSAATLPIGPLLLQLRVGGLLSIIGAFIAVLMAKSLGVGKFSRRNIARHD